MSRPLVGDGDAGRLLAAVLEREQAEVRETRHVPLLRADAEDAAHQQIRRLPGASQVLKLHSEEGTAARDTDAAHRHAELGAEPANVLPHLGRTRQHGASADLAEERERIVVERQLARRIRRRSPPRRDRRRARPPRSRGRASRAAPPARGSETSRASASRSSGPGVPLTSPKSAWYSEPASESGEASASSTESPSRQPFGNAPHVRDEPDRADDRRRVDRAAVRLVVERDVARDDREPERVAGRRHAVDRLARAPSRSRASPGSRS